MTIAVEEKTKENNFHHKIHLDKVKQKKSLYERKDGTLTALGKDGVRRIASPYVSSTGNIGWTMREHDSKSLVTAYPVEKIDSRTGSIILRALIRAVVQGSKEIRADYRLWEEEASPVKKAIEFAVGMRQSHSSDHEHFDITRYPEYQQLEYCSKSRRGR